MKYMPQAMILIPKTEPRGILCLGTLDPWGFDLGILACEGWV